jgi:2-methylcitrate dehydratase PrpD
VTSAPAVPATELVATVEAMVARVAAAVPAAVTVEVAAHVGLVLADTLGVVAAGAHTPELRALAADPMLRLAPGWSALTPARTLNPNRGYADPATAAWFNGTAGTMLELDEGFRPTGHPAVQVVPAALAVAEELRASGAALVTAVVAGYEVAARLFESFALPPAWHAHGHLAGLGAATAVAMLRGIDPVAAARVAATQPLLTGWEDCYAGATARNTWAGHANRTGVLATVLVGAGFTGSLAGHLSVLAPHLARTAPLREPVTSDGLRIRRNYLKFHSACATHSSLDAARQAWRALGEPDPGTIRAVRVTTVPANARVDRQAAPNSLSTRFSLPYAVATLLRTGSTAPPSFDWDVHVAELARRVTVDIEPEWVGRWPRMSPSRVQIETDAGAVGEAEVDDAVGHHTRPAARADVLRKFLALHPEPESDATFGALVDTYRVRDCAELPLPGGTGAARISGG